MKYFHLLALATLVAAKPKCKCTAGQNCWPSQSDFQQLASQVSQPLLIPRPPESACYPTSSPSGNCSDVQANTSNGIWRADQAGSMQSPNFETYVFKNGSISACYLNTTLNIPCEQGSVPVTGVDIRTIADARAAVKFAADHNLRVSIKNTGHDYLGRSTARDSFLIWTHHLKNITYNDSFIPEGSSTSETFKALTLGAGVQWHEAYDAAEQNNRIVVGGVSAGGSVGAAGGWVLGGGHSVLSSTHGLGVDNVLQFTVVTVDGEYRVANNHENADLFWALRGGGGGTYALVLSATYKTHDPVPVTQMLFSANFTSQEEARSVYTEFVKLNPILADNGWGGYGYLTPVSLQFLYLAINHTQEEVNATTQNFVTHAANITGDAYALIQPFESYYKWYTTNFAGGEQVGSNTELGSRLISTDLSRNNPQKVVDVILAVNASIGMNFIAGGAVAKFDPDSVGLNPNWRKGVAHVYVGAGWQEGASLSEIKAARDEMRRGADILDGLSPSSATYLNEAQLYERDFKKSFFGSHYNKLRAIQKKYDPKTLFLVASGVGSDEWDGSLNCPV